MKKIFFSLLGLSLLLPLTTYAQVAACGGEKDFGWVVCTINQKVITPLIGLVVALAMLFFMWGLIKYLGGDTKNKEEAKGVMWFSVLAMFVMFSIWGLVRVLMGTLEITGEETAPIPRVYP